ncbi:hypothetical protein DUI70_1843 [Streptomyces albus]|nr:hypothetical protein DUI70_1843 [Streptomyces albus]
MHPPRRPGAAAGCGARRDGPERAGDEVLCGPGPHPSLWLSLAPSGREDLTF